MLSRSASRIIGKLWTLLDSVAISNNLYTMSRGTEVKGSIGSSRAGTGVCQPKHEQELVEELVVVSGSALKLTLLAKCEATNPKKKTLAP